MATKDYYKILGVKKNASKSDIKKAYRRLARKYHPDINPGDQAAEDRFKQIQEAYAVLKDPDQRRSYDQFGQRMPHGADAQGFGGFRGFETAQSGGFGGFGDVFSDLFGGWGRSRNAPPGPRKGNDLEYHVSIPFLEAVNGTKTRIGFRRPAGCGLCGGTGSMTSSAVKPCSTCGGRGQVQQTRGPLNVATPCPDCGGSGQVGRGDCPECGGSGKRQIAENFTVRIPAGVNNGSRIRVPAKGEAGEFGGPPGDLYLVIKVQAHELFRRDGNNILCQIPVTLAEVALGAKIEVPTVDGKAWLKIPAGTQSGQKFRLKGRGAPRVKDLHKGDQIVEVQVVLPTIGDERSKELLLELANLNPENPRRQLGLR